MAATKTISVGQILTAAEIKQATAIWRKDKLSFHNECLNKIIKPNIERINRALGQKNDPRFLTYAVEFAMMQIKHHGENNAT